MQYWAVWSILGLTLTLLTWTIWRAPTNASKWRMGFSSAFKRYRFFSFISFYFAAFTFFSVCVSLNYPFFMGVFDVCFPFVSGRRMESVTFRIISTSYYEHKLCKKRDALSQPSRNHVSSSHVLHSSLLLIDHSAPHVGSKSFIRLFRTALYKSVLIFKDNCGVMHCFDSLYE